MLKKLALIGAFFVCCGIASAQNPARFDLPILTTTPAQTPVGSLPDLLAVTNATVNVCGYPATLSSGMCTNTITTYTDSTLSTSCPSTAQLTAPGTSVCISTTGLQGTFGFWYNAATQTHMTYTVQTTWGTFGPYDIAPGSSSGGSGTVTNFTSGNLSPLFTTAVANPNTTPAQTFTASTFGAHTFYGNNTGSTATPGAVLIGATDWSVSDFVAGNGSAQAQTITLTPAPTALVAGLEVRWLPVAANTATAPTLNVNGLGARVITKLGTAGLTANDLTTTAVADAIYDGTYWQLQNPQASSGGGCATCIVTNPTAAQTITLNTNGANELKLLNNNAGTSAESAYVLSNGTNEAAFALTGTGNTSPNVFGIGPITSGVAMQLQTLSAPMVFSTGNVAGPPIYLDGSNNIDLFGSLNYAVDTGTANNYVVNIPNGGSTLFAGEEVNFKAANASTGASTLITNGSTSEALVKNGSTALTTGDILAGAIYTAKFDGANWQLLNSSLVGGGGLPTATVEGQTPVSTGAGTTYVAGLDAANNFSASSTTPLNVFCHMRDDSDGLWISYSTDGTNWQEAQIATGATSASLRDPSCMYYNGTFYFASTNNGAGPTPDETIAYFTSTDLQTFTSMTYPVVNASAQSVWAPEFFHDPVSGNYYVIAGVSLASNTRVPYIAQFTPSSGTFGTWSALTLNGTQEGNSLDYFMVYANSKYYLFYSDSGGTFEALSYATSTTLTGTYTQINSAGTNFLTGAAPPANTAQEGPALFPLSNGCTRFIYDFWNINNAGPLNPNYHTMQSDNCDGTLTTWTTAVPMNISKSEHGTVIELTDNPTAQIVFNLTRTKPSNAFNSGLSVNAPTTSDYATVQINSLLNANPINSNIPGSIAMDGDASDTWPYLHSGWIGGCYGTLGGSTCPQPASDIVGVLQTNGMANYNGVGAVGAQGALYWEGQAGGTVSNLFGPNHAAADMCCSAGEARFLVYGPNTSTVGSWQWVNTSSDTSVYTPIFNTVASNLNVLVPMNATTITATNNINVTGNSANVQGFKDSTPTYAWDIAYELPAGSPGNNPLFNYYDGTNWHTGWDVNSTNGILESPNGFSVFTTTAATSSANANSPTMSWLGNFYNGTTHVPDPWNCYVNLSNWSSNPDTAPSYLECDYSGSATSHAFKTDTVQADLQSSVVNIFNLSPNIGLTLATSGISASGTNYSSPYELIAGNIYNGTVQVSDQYLIQDVVGPTATNPTSTLTVSKGTGTTGPSAVSFSTLPVQLPAYLVSGLPSASTTGAGFAVEAKDATNTSIGTCTGSGTAGNYVIAVSNGTNWICP